MINRMKPINVPKGIRYISDWYDYSLENFRFPHILNKQITGCGFTEYCLRNDMNIILCSPRRVLLENKETQHENEVLYVKNELEGTVSYDKDITSTIPTKGSLKESQEIDPEELKEQIRKMKGKINSYILHQLSINKPCKILVTYDSFRIVKETLLENHDLPFDQFYTVVDEFQSIFVDSKFKSSTEIEFLSQLNGVRDVCYVSATPMMDRYLDMLEEFKDLPYYELDWKTLDPGRVIMPQLTVKSTTKLFNEIRRIIESYKSGDFEKSSWRDNSGKIQEIESKEAVIYVNSVKNICDIISRLGLTPEETNVLCSNTPENLKKIRKAFGLKKGQLGGIGKVPKEGELHKMFTLCTRTVYLGADFCSTNARTFIFSDANLDCLSVDITLDLPQILGRQRLNKNPWKNRAELYFKVLSRTRQKTMEQLNILIEEKKKTSLNLLKSYEASPIEAKHDLAVKFKKDTKASNYRDDYVAVNSHSGSDLLPVFNNLVLVAEIRTSEIQQIDYKDRFTVFNALKDNGLAVDEDEAVLLAKLDEFNGLIQFTDKMKLICSTEFSDELQQSLLSQVPPIFGNYYNTVGPKKIKALLYRPNLLKTEYDRLVNNQDINLEDLIYKNFIVGEKYLNSTVKIMISNIFKECGFKETPKASILSNYFSLKSYQATNKETNKRDNGVVILSKKGEN